MIFFFSQIFTQLNLANKLKVPMVDMTSSGVARLGLGLVSVLDISAAGSGGSESELNTKCFL